MSLSWFLSFVLVALILLSLFGFRAIYRKLPPIAGHLKKVIGFYVIALSLILVWMVVHFIGWGTKGSPEIPHNLQRRLAHTGYYFGRRGELTIRGAETPTPAPIRRNETLADMPEQDEEQREIIRKLMPAEALEVLGEQPREKAAIISNAGSLGFSNPALQTGEFLTLKPIWAAEKAQEWTLAYRLRNLPLRVSEAANAAALRCVNIPSERWLKPGDTILISRVSGGQTFFTSFQWTTGSKYPWRFKRTTNSYQYGAGTIAGDGTLQYTKGPGTLMSEVVLSDGAVLANLVRRARKEFRDDVGSIEQEWWAIFSSLILIRENRDDRNSRIGLIISDSFFQEPGRQIYINYSGPASQPLAALTNQPVTNRVPTSGRVSYGLRARENSFELELPGEVTADATWGQIVRVPFIQPKVWPLPPQPNQEFIITSTNEYIPLDGYLIETGNPRHSFYAKAQLNEALDELSINDGKNVVRPDSKTGKDTVEPRRFQLGTPATIGDYDQGVLFGLLPSQSPQRSVEWLRWLAPNQTGRAATALILVNGLLFLLLLWRDKLNRPTLFLVWSAIWGIGLTLLCIRLMLIYRVSLSPPFDATLSEVRNVFDKGVDYALLGLLALVLLTLALNLAGKYKRQFNLGKRKVILLVLLWALIITGYTIAGRFLGTNQAFLSIRISLADHLLVVVGLALLARNVLEHARALTVLLLLLTLALEIFVVKDAGSIIYSWSFLFVVITVWGWRRPRRFFSNWFANTVVRFTRARRIRRVLSAPLSGPRVSAALTFIGEWVPQILIPMAAISTFLVLPYVIQVGWMRKVVEPALPDTAFYRFASFTDSEDVMLTTKRGEEVTDMSKLLDNSLQRWQMLVYASRGLADSVGYGRAPLSRIGMTYPTSVSDCAFATYVLAEHGRSAATLLLVLYLLLACFCVIGAWHFDDNVRHRIVALMAIAAFFVFNALYMASANIGFMTFTGQNLPLLGLASGGDLLQGVVLLCLTGWLLLDTRQESRPRYLRQKSPVVFRWSIGLVLVSLIWFLTVTWHMGKMKDAIYWDDHDLKEEIFEQIAKDLPRGNPANPQENAPLILVGEKLEVDQGAKIMEIEEQYRKQFNERTDKFNPQGGLYYLQRVRGEDLANQLAVRVNKRFFFARSPFTELTQWRGRIVASGDRDPTLYALGLQFRISLREGGIPTSIDLGKPSPGPTNAAVLLREDARQYFQLQRTGDVLTLHPKSGEWSVYVNGTRVIEPLDLEPLSIIVIERREIDPQRRNLIYLGPTGPILAYVRWRNGGYRRMFPEGNITLPYFLGNAADRTFAMEAEADIPQNERIKPELALTLDLALHKKLQQRLIGYAGTHSNYGPFRTYPNRLSATVIDAFSGEVLAIPSWPLLDSNKPQYEVLVDKLFEPARSRFENNGNLVTDHVVGSTLKPIVFSTLASQLWPEHDLARFRVFNRTDPSRHSSNGGNDSHLHWRVGGIRIEEWDCNSATEESDMGNFLIHSLDYPEGLLGMFGMIRNKPEIDRVMVRDDESPDISYNEAGYKVDLTRVGPNSVFTLQDQFDGRLAVPLASYFINDTVLFSGLNSVFNFESGGAVEDRTQRACATFLPSFANSKLSLSKNEYLDNVLAKRLDMNGGDFMGVRQGLISCFLGGAPCVFNNVMMAEAAARLATGKRVFARIEAVPDQNISADLPAPLNDSRWRNENVITPMEQVARVGTAKALTTNAASRVHLPANYRMIYKTGTIVEGNEGRESEALMFVIGRWENGSFVRNETLAGFLYMEKSKNKDQNAPDGNMKKFGLAAILLNETVQHLTRIRR
jgi:hypothetical protein